MVLLKSQNQEMEARNQEMVYNIEFNYPSPETLLNHTLLILPPSPTFSPPWNFSQHGDSDNDSPANSIFNSNRSVPAGENGGVEGDDDDDKKKVPSPVLGFPPIDNFDVSFLIKERMTQALRYFIESTEQKQILAQIWAPVKSGNNYVLTTSGQPFVLGPHSNGLNQYRTVSLMYMFSVDGEGFTTHGLPGRVFRQKLPEWTPNVQYYSSKEYPQVNHAKRCNVRGTLALPVFEPSGQSCVGVLELIMTSQKINYAPEVDKVCKALEAVNFKSSKILDHPDIQICNEGRQNALAEILELLTEVCETYKLPLALTWVPCRHKNVLGDLKKSCSSFDGNCMGQVCMSTTDVAFYVVDAHMWGFREACAEHHLQKGQGVAGRSFSCHGLSYCRDISQFCKIDYPLVHYARMSGVTGSFAICLRSKHTGDNDYVLEFFLPLNLSDSSLQLSLLDSILATMKDEHQNFTVASGRTLEEERKHMEIVEVSMDENQDLQVDSNLSIRPLSMLETMNGVLPSVKKIVPHLGESDVVNAGKSVVEDWETEYFKTTGRTLASTLLGQPNISVPGRMSPDGRNNRQASEDAGMITINLENEHGILPHNGNDHDVLEVGLNKEPQSDGVSRGTQKIVITREMIQPFLSKNMTLVAAAQHLGATRSTLKRRLKEYNIQWPRSNKRKQVDAEKTEHNTEPPSRSSSPQVNLVNPTNPTAQYYVAEADQPALLDHLPVECNVHDSASKCTDGAVLHTLSSNGLHGHTNSSILVVKVTYKELKVKFKWSSTASLCQLHKAVADNLQIVLGRFRITYQDEENDWLLLNTKEHLKDALSSIENNILTLKVIDM